MTASAGKEPSSRASRNAIVADTRSGCTALCDFSKPCTPRCGTIDVQPTKSDPREMYSMLRLRHAVHLCAWVFLLTAVSARAETPLDPLRLVPDVADVVLEVKTPRRLAETATQHELFRQLQQLAPVHELL